MNSDPHPLNGWARFLSWHRRSQNLTPRELHSLQEAVNKAEQAYRHWRPEMRYKTTDVKPEQLDAVRRAAKWFLENQGRI